MLWSLFRGEEKIQPDLLCCEQLLSCSEVPELLWTGSFIPSPELISYISVLLSSELFGQINIMAPMTGKNLKSLL